MVYYDSETRSLPARERREHLRTKCEAGDIRCSNRSDRMSCDSQRGSRAVDGSSENGSTKPRLFEADGFPPERSPPMSNHSFPIASPALVGVSAALEAVARVGHWSL
jgi:hypothetical protein